MKCTERLLVSSVVILFAFGACPWLPTANGQNELGQKVGALEAQLLNQASRIKELEARQGLAVVQTDLERLLAQGTAGLGPQDFRAYWDNGLRFASGDGSVKLKLGGRIMYDFGWISHDDQIEDIVGDLTDGVETRRARLYAAGTIYDNVDFKLQFDFAAGDADLKDAYIRLKDVPMVDSVTIGHFKEPFGLEELTSSKYITFLERSLPTEAFTPARNGGIMVHSKLAEGRGTWAIGAFRSTDDFGDTESERGYAVTGRVTCLPWYQNKGEQLLHVGAAYSHRTTDDSRSARFRSRPEYHNTERFVDTNPAADRVDLFGLESALILGPLSLQAEFMAATTGGGGADADEVCLKGMYFQTSYFLTGEHRPYITSSGTFGRVKPKTNFGADGTGAVELTARYSYLDLNDGSSVRGGRLSNGTVGVNWYLNPNVRFMLNYVHANLHRDDDSGDVDLFMVRAQVDF